MFNIITPTYNRAHTLERVFNSLKSQSMHAFKWIIVDDGSSDGTKQLVDNWILNHQDLNIEYFILPENKGKPYAVNYGVQKATYLYTLIADSDDSFDANTLEYLRATWEDIPSDEYDKIGAIWSLTQDEDQKVLGDKFPMDRWQVNFYERVLNQEKPIKGDKWHCWKTELLKRFPLYYEEKCHIGESHTWNLINKNYDFVCINTVFLTVHRSEVSLMNTSRSKKNRERAKYMGSYYELSDVSISHILKFKYYRYMAFQYIRSQFYYRSTDKKLSTKKTAVLLLIFIVNSPVRILNKLI